MRKRLTIKGHPTRGKEVIELLEMLGGDNSDTQCRGIEVDFYYYIDTYGCINYEDCFIVDEAEFFTLEEFWEKFPFKIGDKVIDTADGCPGVVSEMKWDEDVSDMKYFVAFGNGIDFGWYANDSIEFYKENKNLEVTQSKRDIDKSEFIIKHMILPNKVDDKLEYKIIDGYEFDKVENNKIILKPIKSKYPTTYVECCEVIANSKPYAMNEHYTDVNKLLQIFQTLIICRNAYWKIAGKELGLDKPWEPDWSTSKPKYVLACTCNGTEKQWETTYCKTFAFPTAEIRDGFYENFKDLIEQCKELL